MKSFSGIFFNLKTFPWKAFILIILIPKIVFSCDFNSAAVLESTANVSTVVGHNVFFICCGGITWTYESDTGFAGREIGEHPVSSNPDDLKKDLFSFDVGTQYPSKTKNNVATTVYRMRDDRGRLILRIDNASLRDSGVYRCNGKLNYVEGYLKVYPPENFPIDRHTGLPSFPTAAEMIKKFEMFSSDKANQVILRCPLTPMQTVVAWEWREPIPPDSDIALNLPEDASPSRTVSFSEPGTYSNGNVEIGPGLAWAKILDPFSPEAPNKLWCKFYMNASWDKKKGHPSYYEIRWKLYEPINVQVKMHNSSEKDLYGHLGWSSGGTDIDYSALYGSLGLEKEKSSLQDRQALMSEARLIEGYPAKLVCLFRPLPAADLSNSGRPIQVASWYLGDRSLPQPPFHVNNSHEGVSVLTVRAYPVSTTSDVSSSDQEVAAIPYEKLTCVVNSQVNVENNYTVIDNASLTLEVIRQPRIIDEDLFTSETSLGGYVKLTCVALANGKPNISIDFSAIDGRKSGFVNDNGTHSAWQPLAQSYSLKIYSYDVDTSKPMLHRMEVNVRGADRENHGAYRCRVSNAAGQAQHIGHLRVRSEPQISIQPLQSTYYFGRQPLIISCLVTGYPLAVNRDVNVTTSTEDGDQPKSSSTSKPPVNLQILNSNMEHDSLVPVKLIDLRMGIYGGINATYSVVINYRLFNEAVARCDYIHIDRTVYSDKVHIREAKSPSAPKIVALCTGPGAVIFGVSNPPASPENEATDKIVSQRVLFAPSSEFLSASNFASKAILLDVHGQPRPEIIDGDEEEVQEALARAKLNPTTTYSSRGQDPSLITIPITNLLPGTNYTFEWSSANQFSLTHTTQFVTATDPLGPPLKPTHFIFLVPTSHHIRLSVFLDDPCPYGNGGRAELSNIIMRYRKAVRRDDRVDAPFVGTQNWSDAHNCLKTRSKVAPGGTVLQNSQSVKWSGDAVIQCELKVSDTTADYEIAVATVNRFGKSPWLPAIYRAEEAQRAAYLYKGAGLSSLHASVGMLFVFCTFILLQIM